MKNFCEGKKYSVQVEEDLRERGEIKADLAEIAAYLNSVKEASITLTGNTGVDPGSLTGGGADVLKEPALMNEKTMSTGDAMKLRAAAVRDILVKDYKIDPSRIKIATGEQTIGAKGRNVGVKVNK